MLDKLITLIYKFSKLYNDSQYLFISFYSLKPLSGDESVDKKLKILLGPYIHS